MVVNSSTEALNHKHHKLVNPPRQLKVLVASHSNNPCGFIVWEAEDLALGQQFLGKQCLWFCPTGEATKSILNVGHKRSSLSQTHPHLFPARCWIICVINTTNPMVAMCSALLTAAEGHIHQQPWSRDRRSTPAAEHSPHWRKARSPICVLPAPTEGSVKAFSWGRTPI